jgi:CDP-diacylglycerol---glycerol-3-phosphate 3-phosphatidyltransferase
MKRHVPNLITIIRCVLTVIFFVLLNTNNTGNFEFQMWLGFVVFVVAGLTDMLDGYLARKWKVESAFGRIVDPFADKILICGAFVFFSSNHFIDVAVRSRFPEFAQNLPFPRPMATPSLTGVVPWMVVVILGREFLVTSIRGLAEAQGVKFRADWAGKIKMVIQAFAAGSVLVNLATLDHHRWIHVTRDIAIWVTVIVTILSATTYILRAWKIFGAEEPKSGGGGAADGE